MTEPAPSTPAELPPTCRIGLLLFAIYSLMYGGFIALAVLCPKVMATKVGIGGNVAVWYGFGLIVAALVLAIIYLRARREKPAA